MNGNAKAWSVGFKWTVGDASNPTGAIAVDTTSKALHIADIDDIATDWNVAADSHPTVRIHSATTPATDFIAMYHDATNGYVNVASGAMAFQIDGTTEMSLAAAALTLSAPLTVGLSGTGYDVTFYGDTAGCDFLWDMNGDTDGSLILGADTTGVDFKAFGATTGNYLLWDKSADDLLLVGSATQLSVAGTTESTSTTTGSLRTAGGLACGGDFYAGDDIFLTSAAVLNFNAGDVTITHGANLLTLAGGNLLISDDLLLLLGTTSDIAMLNQSASVLANTGVTGVLIGTPVTAATAANSLLVSNVTASGDIGFFLNDTSGNSWEYYRMDGSAKLQVFNEAGSDIDLRAEGDNNANLFILDAGGDNIAFGRAVQAGAFISLDGSAQNRAWTSGAGILIDKPGGQTYTSTNADPTTLAIGALINYGGSTFAGANANQVITEAATLRIASAPAQGTNMTLSSTYAFWVDAGATQLDGAVTIGRSAAGVDTTLYGATTGCSALWDASEDQLVITQTNAATTGVERTLDVSQTHTGIGASAEALRSTITTNVAGGTYMNALFGKIDFQTAGKVTGLAGVICGELTMAGGAVSQGTYCVFEAEINLPTSYSSSVPVEVMRIEAWGAQKATFDTTGYLFEIVGCSSTNNGFWYDATNGTTDEWIRVKTPSGDRWLMLSDVPTEA